MNPGKFEISGAIGERLYDLSMDGCDDEFGDVETVGWHGLLLETGIDDAPHAIVREDNDGFWYYDSFDASEEAEKEFRLLAAEYQEVDEE